MQSPTLTADLNGTRTDRIAEEIRVDIARNVLRGGTRLTEESLALDDPKYPTSWLD